MPKKKTPVQFRKPTSSTHPSLVVKHDSKSHIDACNTTVNGLLLHLRQSQAPSKSDRPPVNVNTYVNTPTVHPSLIDVLQIPDTLPPRPRPGPTSTMRRSRIRGPPGPSAPSSWLASSIHAPAQSQERRGFRKVEEVHNHLVLRGLKGLPNAYFLPEEGSLMGQTLKSLAKNWDWHIEYDQFYLATLPVRCKAALLSYIAVYSPAGISYPGLKTLLLDEKELTDATGSDSLTHLDLAGSVGYQTFTLKDLNGLFNNTEFVPRTDGASMPGDSTISLPPTGKVPDSWDSPAIPFHLPLTATRFPSLTHLSLSHPDSKFASWRILLKICSHFTTLTHLSLAYWPTPSLTPNSKTAITATPGGNVSYGASDFYSTDFGDWSEAAGILKWLSKKTLCLKWLDLEGCSAWVEALVWREDLGCENDKTWHQMYPKLVTEYTSFDKGSKTESSVVDWCGSWRGMENVRLGQGWTPERILRQRPGKLAPESAVWPGHQIQNEKDEDQREFHVRKDLAKWAHVERKIAGVEEILRLLRSKGRCRRVAIDRGWNESWVETALKKQDMNSTIAALSNREGAQNNSVRG